MSEKSVCGFINLTNIDFSTNHLSLDHEVPNQNHKLNQKLNSVDIF